MKEKRSEKETAGMEDDDSPCTASVRQHRSSCSLEGIQDAIASDRSPNLLRAGRDEEGRLQAEASILGLLGERRCARKILVRRVGARADVRGRELSRPSRFGDAVLEDGDGVREVGSEGAIDVRFEFGEVDLDVSVVLGSLVGLEVSSEGLKRLDGCRAARLMEEATHGVSIREDGGSGANLGAHVANRTHSGAAERVNSFAEVLDDMARSSFDGEDGGELENDIYARE